MPKNPLEELDELLAKSQRLNAQLSDAGSSSRQLNRGISELDEASRMLSQGFSSRQFPGSAPEDHFAKNIYDEVNSINLQNSRETFNFEGADIDGYLAHHHDMIMLTAMEESRRLADENLNSLQRKWITNDWESAKVSFMESLGHRAHLWNDTVDSQALTVINPIDNKIFSPKKDYTLTGTELGPKAVTKQPLPTEVSKFAQVVRSINLAVKENAPRSNKALPCEKYLQAIQEIGDKGSLQSKADLLSFKTLVSMLASMTGEGKSDIGPGYYSAISMDKNQFENLNTDDKRQKLTFGGKRYLENQIMDIWTYKLDAALAKGDVSLGFRADSSSIHHRLHKFVEYEMNYGSLFQFYSSNNRNFDPIWAYLYHYLRAGQLSIAIAELESKSKESSEEALVLYILKSIASESDNSNESTGSIRTPSKSRTTETSSTNPKKLKEVMDQCKTLYEKEIRKKETDIDPYKSLVLNLLGLVDKRDLAGASVANFSFEDFLWTHLWFIDSSRLIRRLLPANPSLSAGFTSPFPSSHTKASSVLTTSRYEGESDLLELVYAYGASQYFDSDRSSPFKYALLLFCCHRFGDAIQYLWLAEKTLAAVHLTILCLYYGLILPIVPLHQNPPHPLVSSSYGIESSFDSINLMPSSLLIQYLQTPLFQSYPDIVIDYLLTLHTNWLSSISHSDQLREILKLKSQEILLESIESYLIQLSRDQLPIVLGQPIDTLPSTSFDRISRGKVRTLGRLDDYLDNAVIDVLIIRVANYYLNHQHDIELAIHFYLLAGKYSRAVNELSNQLLALLFSTWQVPDQSNLFNQKLMVNKEQQRLHWRQLADRFIEHFIKRQGSNNQSTTVMNNLLQEGWTDRVDYLMKVIGLYEFVDRFLLSGDAKSALEVFDTLNLIPMNSHQLQYFDGMISTQFQTILDDLLLFVEECIHVYYQECKRQSRNMTSTSITGLNYYEDSMNLLRQRSQTLIQYAQKVRNQLTRPDTLGLLTRLDANFI